MNISYDLIIVSQSSPALIPVTEQCIKTARQDNVDLNIIVIESGKRHEYDVDTIIEYEGTFNYNRALNIGLEHRKKDIHILANNDIIFHPGWSRIGELMRNEDYHSASALSGHLTMFQRGDFVYEGYHVGYILTGWCLFLDDYVLDRIGKLDETCSFWFSDNLYACQLKAAEIRHGMFANIYIDHMASQTLNRQPSRMQRKYQIGELQKYNQRSHYYAQRERANKVNT